MDIGRAHRLRALRKNSQLRSAQPRVLAGRDVRYTLRARASAWPCRLAPVLVEVLRQDAWGGGGAGSHSPTVTSAPLAAGPPGADAFYLAAHACLGRTHVAVVATSLASIVVAGRPSPHAACAAVFRHRPELAARPGFVTRGRGIARLHCLQWQLATCALQRVVPELICGRPPPKRLLASSTAVHEVCVFEDRLRQWPAFASDLGGPRWLRVRHCVVACIGPWPWRREQEGVEAVVVSGRGTRSGVDARGSLAKGRSRAQLESVVHVSASSFSARLWTHWFRIFSGSLEGSAFAPCAHCFSAVYYMQPRFIARLRLCARKCEFRHGADWSQIDAGQSPWSERRSRGWKQSAEQGGQLQVQVQEGTEAGSRGK